MTRYYPAVFCELYNTFLMIRYVPLNIPSNTHSQNTFSQNISLNLTPPPPPSPSLQELALVSLSKDCENLRTHLALCDKRAGELASQSDHWERKAISLGKEVTRLTTSSTGEIQLTSLLAENAQLRTQLRKRHISATSTSTSTTINSSNSAQSVRSEEYTPLKSVLFYHITYPLL